MAYKVNHTDTANYGSIIVEDKTVNTDTSISLLGIKYAGYAKTMAENLLHMLENFASKDAPDNPTIGQLWYNSDSSAVIPNPSLMVWDGIKWTTANNITKSTTEPSSALIGNLWVDTTTSQLKVWNGSSWSLIGPESRTDVDGKFTGFRYGHGNDHFLLDSASTEHQVIEIIIRDDIVAILSTTDFVPGPVITGFPHIYQGINLSTAYKFTGTASWASGLEVNGSNITSDKFLRRDEPSPNFTNGLKVQSNDGIKIGTSLGGYLHIAPSTNNLSIDNNSTISIQSTSGVEPTILSLNDDGVSSNKPLTVLGAITSLSSQVTGDALVTGTINSNVVIASDHIEVGSNGTLIPSVNGTGSVGTGNNKWSAVNAINITCESLTTNLPLSGSISQNIAVAPSSGTTTYKLVTTGTTLKSIGDVTAIGVPTQGKDEILFKAQLGVGAITDKPQLNNYDSNTKFLVEQNSVLKTMSLYQISIPVGAVMLFAGAFVPTGYLLCDGAMYSTTDYAQLYLAIGTTYGAGTGTFAVPDLTANSVGGIKYYINSGKW